jgi:hypothetical protein
MIILASLFGITLMVRAAAAQRADLASGGPRSVLMGLESVPTRTDTAPPPAGLLGSFLDDYGNSFRISAELFEQMPLHRFHVVSWHSRERYLIARNDDANPSDAGKWTRIDWMPLEGMAPYAWAFCLTAYRAATEADARATPPADRAVPRTGCAGYPFSRLKPLG